MTATVSLIRHRTSLVWSLLVVLTGSSWMFGTHAFNHRLGTVVVLAIAFTKMRFVGLYFMDLANAPSPLRLLFEAYCGIVGAGIIAMYLVL